MALGEVGRCGVAIASLDDMRRLFDGIDQGAVSTSMTINAPAAILLAFYAAVAEERGAPLEKLRGTLQNDILKEFHAQNEYVFPPEPSFKLVIDAGKGEPGRELFDLENDQAEENNLIDTRPEIGRELERRLRTWQESVLNSLTGADY